MANFSALPPVPQYSPGMLANANKHQIRPRVFTVFAAKSGPLNSILNRCQKCGGKGAIECTGCKGTGKNKKNGNIFERWKCFDCQGFGLKSCPICGKGGLTPEQRGER
ncbi:protein PHOTOSYSTEM I ASSEMBLY 2, chloroplastic-like isoform X1 [Hibiscus syriacus]|uniref:protein PHOTOSYSTEM I ASSEMBLY 2, chloroplastic-like isoform X1 n=1 Tax=Hibiscus syriacus TaxID=106335 RepID=UPI00192275DD|nr:protein PHOTOSYSTEM I ASSEMBLY 2, chloroplastic-like isoform X1 [Hibiscus syriacus]